MGATQAQLQAWWRRRELASDRRAGVWVRAEAARRELAFLKSTWRRLTAAAVVAGVVISVMAVLVPAGFLRGLVVGGGVVGVLATLVMLTREATGTSSTRSGANAEQWTASELRPLQRAGWRLINHFQHWGEIDHLLIGPAGVIVVETKWRSRGWSTDPSNPDLQTHLRHLRQRQRQVQVMREVQDGHSAVRPVLFLWGGGGSANAERSDTYEMIDGVTVIRGHTAAVAWRERALTTPATLNAERIDQIFAAVDRRIVDGDRKELKRAAVPPSIERVYLTFFGCFCTASAAVIFGLQLFSHDLQPGLQMGVTALALLLGLAIRKLRSLRLLADAWLAGIGGVALIATFVFLAS